MAKKTDEATTKFKVDISDLTKNITAAKKQMALASAEFKNSTAGLDNWSKSADGVSSKLTQLGKNLQSQRSILTDYRKQYELTKNQYGENSKAAVDLKIKIENQEAALKTTEKSIDKYNNVLAELTQEQNKTVSATDHLSDTINAQEKSLTDIKKEYASVVLTQGKNSEAAKNLAKQIEDLSTDLSDNKKALKDANDAADALDNSYDDLEDGARDAGAAAEESSEGFTVMKGVLANLVAEGIRKALDGLKDLAADALETGRTFESSMSEVQAISGATGEDLKLLSDTAKEFGASTVFSASESADALKYMALAGWDAHQSTDALGGVLNLAAASGMDLAKASDMVTDYLSAFGMQAKDSAYFADLLAYSQSNSNTSAEQLGEAYKNCAANLNAAGQDIETTTSLLAMMANQGLKGSEGGTALTAVMRDMTAKMKDGAIAIGDTNVQVMDAEGNYRDLTDILKDVEKATDGMGDAQKATALASTFTSDSIKGLNLILNAGVSNAEDFEKQLRKCSGSAENMANVMNDNLEGDLKALNSAYEDLGITIYESATGSMREFVKEVTNDLMPAIKDSITGVEGADEALGEAVSNLILMALDEVTSMLPRAANLGISIAGSLIQGVLDSLPDIADAAIDMASEILSGLSKQLPKIATKAADVVPQIITAILAKLPDLIAAGITLVQGLVSALPQIIDSLVAATPQIIQALIDGLLSGYQALTDGAISLLMAIVSAVPQIIDSLVAALPQIIDSVISGLLGAIPQLLEACISFWMAIIDALPQITVAIIDALPQIITTIIEVLIENIPLLLDCAVELFMTLVQAIPQIILELRKSVPQIIASIMMSLAKLGPKLATFGGEILAKVIAWFGNMVAKAAEYGLKFVNGLAEKIESIPGELKDIFDKGIQKVVEFGGNLKEKAKDAGRKFVDTIKDAIKGLPDDIKDIGGHFIEGFWDGITDKFGWLTDKLEGFADGVMDKLKNFFGIHSPSRRARDEIGKFLDLGVADGVDQYKHKVYESLRRIVDEAKSVTDEGFNLDDVKKHMPRPKSGGGGEGGSTTNNTTTYNFVQNNTSPKPLNRLEIYRQTKNLIDPRKPEVS